MQETEARAYPLDFTQAFSARSTRQLTAAACLAFLLLLVPSMLAADQAADFGRRLLSAWVPAEAPAGPGYTVQVQPGDIVVAQGKSMTIRANLSREREAVNLPATSALVTTDTRGKTMRLAMQADPTGSFTYKMNSVPGNLTYHVEAGEAISPSYQITVILPVELAPQSPTIRITPPSYVNLEVHPVKIVQGIAELSALQYSAVHFAFRFNRPAVAARVELIRKPTSGAGDHSLPVVLPLVLAGDRGEGSLDLPALPPGDHQLKLVLEAEHRITTAVDLRTLSIWADDPPTFTEVPRGGVGNARAVKAAWKVEADPLGNRFIPVRSLSAGGEVKSAAPDDVLALRVSVEDKVGVDRAEIEYRVNEGASSFETLFQSGGALQGNANHFFQLAGKVKDGDMLYYRIQAADNRKLTQGSLEGLHGERVPATDLGPNVIYYPAREKDQDRWIALRIDRQAVPLAEQDVIAQRDQLRTQIDAIQQKLRNERTELHKVETAMKAQPRLSPEQSAKLHELREKNREIRADLRALAQEAAKTPAVPEVAEKAADIAEQEMNRSDEALGRAEEKKTEDAERKQQLKKSDQELASAMKRLEDLNRLNDRVAQDRLDQMKMERLAQREDQLAKKAGELAEKEQPQNARNELPDLKADQARLAEELKRLASESKLFKNAMEASRAEEARDLARKAKELAQAQRELNEAEKATFARENQSRLAELTRKQQELAQKADRLGKDTKPTTKTQGAQPLRPEEAKKAAESLKQSNLGQALQHQERAARELDRVARDLEKPAPKKGNDQPSSSKGLPKDEAAKQARALAKAQTELRREVQKLASDVAKSQPTGERAQQLARQQELQKESGMLAKELRKLGQEPPAGQAQQSAQHAAQAAQQAENAMRQAQAKAQEGNEGQAQQAGNQAAQKLEEAARAAEKSGAPSGRAAEAKAAAMKAGEALRQGQKQAVQAQRQLDQGKAQAAQAAMQQAAQAMKEASQQAQAMTRAQRAGMPNPDSRFSGLKGVAPLGVPDPSLLGKDMKQFAGRPWGELPGTLRTRILQDMRGRYGEDYARIIQRYFEQIADTSKP